MPDAKTLAEALVAFQADAPKIALDAENPHFRSKFPSLAGVMDTVRPALARHGLGLMQMPSVIDGGLPALTTRLVHGPSGETLETTMLLLPAKADPQGQGSALTYARRYAVLGFLGLVGDEDDDDNAASTPAKVEKSKPKFTAPAAKTPDEEAVRLASELLELVGQIGDGNGTRAELVPATQALIAKHAGDKDWIKRQIVAAKKTLETASPIPF